MQQTKKYTTEMDALNSTGLEKTRDKLYSLEEISGSLLYLGFKKIIDFIFGIMGFMFFILIYLPITIIIKIDSPGPVIFKQKRMGKNGEEFILYKFRSMVSDAEAKTGAVWAKKNDPRVTNIGRILRKTRIDEIPQFINILKGEMSVVGPRPERPILTEKFAEQYPGFKDRLVVKPGITGLAQITKGYDVEPHQKLRLDLFYIENRSILLDFKIILTTIKVMICGHGAR